MFRKSLPKFISENDLLPGILDAVAPLFAAGKRQHYHVYDLVDPNFIFKKRSKIDNRIMFDFGLIPFGHCGNGDFIVVDARPNSRTSEVVCILSHDYAWEHADEINDILTDILRPIANSISDFCESVQSSECELPIDYHDNNPEPYIPEYMKRGPKAMRKKRG